MEAIVHIYQNKDGTKLTSNTYFIEGNYSDFRNEFYLARYTEIDYYERWELIDGTTIFYKGD